MEGPRLPGRSVQVTFCPTCMKSVLSSVALKWAPECLYCIQARERESLRRRGRELTEKQLAKRHMQLVRWVAEQEAMTHAYCTVPEHANHTICTQGRQGLDRVELPF